MKPTGATKEATGHSPLPWHVFEGGNFIKVATEGYDEYTEKEHYLGGPFSVAEMEYNATKNHSPNHAKALANAQLIVAAVNERERLREVLRKLRDLSNQHTCNGEGSNCDRCSALELADAALNDAAGRRGVRDGNANKNYLGY